MENVEIGKLERDAQAFATRAHQGQARKYTGLPYITHCAEVALIVRSVPDHTEEMLAAAWLHDTVEDCDIQPSSIELKFGEAVSELVMWLTDISVPEDGNRKIRKQIDRDHMELAPPQAKTIKLADIISNTCSITKHDPEFAKVYLPEKRALLVVLRGGDPSLWQRAYDIANTLPVKQAQAKK